MKRIIKNYEELNSSPLRNDALEIVEAGLRAIDTETVLENSVIIEGDILTIQGHRFTLSDYRHIYIIGFGKVACTAAHTLENIFKGRIKDGAVIGLAEKVCQVVYTYAGTHPLPSQLNYIATKHIAEVARCAKENDLVLVVVSGGGSALLCSSMGECDQGVKLFDSFLQTGGTIEEMNLVRKHISQLKGGGLAKSLYPATVLGLIFSDVPGGDMASVASGPTCFDSTTANDAQAIIDKYNLGHFLLTETPKDPKYFDRVHNFIIVSNVTALNAMQEKGKELGYRSDLVSATAYATAEETATLLTNKASTGTLLCMGGETKVTVPENSLGKGGRNGYLSLTMLEKLVDGQVFVSLASDGHDNTDVAGVLIDSMTSEELIKQKLEVSEFKDSFNSFSLFEKVGGHIVTGLLESNVSDLMLLLTPQSRLDPVPITNIQSKIILDSRGTKTIEVTVSADSLEASFSVPAGASTGTQEVSIIPAEKVAAILKNIVLPALLGMDVLDQKAIDVRLHELGKTTRFDAIGGNVALGVSIAVCKLAAKAQGVETWQRISELFKYKEQANSPRLFINLINGGKHAKVGSAIQEHQIIPDTDNIKMALETALAVQGSLKEVLAEHFKEEDITIGDEGGFVIPSKSLIEPFSYITEAISRTRGEIPVIIGTDIAASSLYKDGGYVIDNKNYSAQELLNIYDELHEKFPLLQMVEDPYDEKDINAFVEYHHKHPGVMTIGDDLTTTSKESLERAIKAMAINGIIIKPNQIGTLTDTLETMSLAYQNKIWCIVSHRSGETMDDFIADLAFGTKCYGFKAGSPSMPERTVKYNRLLQISG